MTEHMKDHHIEPKLGRLCVGILTFLLLTGQVGAQERGGPYAGGGGPRGLCNRPASAHADAR